MANKEMERTEIFDTEDEVVARFTNLIDEKSKAAIAARGRFLIALSGSTDVIYVCRSLPLIKTDWSKWKFLFCDERIVPFGDPESTFDAYRRGLYSKIPIKDDNFIAIDPNLPPKEAAADYERKMRALYPTGTTLPKLDLLLMGAGPDGHTCSLFPGHPLLDVTDKWVASIEDSPKPPPRRVTLTYPVINNALCVIFPFAGQDRAELMRRLLKDREDLPARRVQPEELIWILDRSAASKIQ